MTDKTNPPGQTKYMFWSDTEKDNAYMEKKKKELDKVPATIVDTINMPDDEHPKKTQLGDDNNSPL